MVKDEPMKDADPRIVRGMLQITMVARIRMMSSTTTSIVVSKTSEKSEEMKEG